MHTSESKPPFVPLSARGRLMNAEEIAAILLSGTKSPRGVRQCVAPSKKLVFGHSTVRWWEADVIAWIDQHVA